jgi:hypothetical protein
VLLTDTFAETGQGAPAPRTGGRLQNHKPAVGGPWREYGGTWTVEGGRLVAPQGGTAVVFTRKPDAAAALTFDLPVPEDVGAGWSAGPVVRYAEGKGYIWARLFHKPGGSPLELWENDGGESRFLGASDVTARVARGGRHTIKLAAVGNRVAVYLDDALVLVRTTSVLEGNWAGILAADVPAGGFTFAGFQAMASKADTVPPPPVTELSGPSSTSDFPTLTWPPAVDDASGTRFYRVFRSTNPAELGRQINQDGATTEPAFTDTSLRSQGTYCYTVVAVDGAGNASPAGSARRCLTYQPGASPAGP